MRLTLRTLLAYLDDRLPPANAREIGQKITNSPFATDLVERIRDVKRRRRLAKPDKSQPMIEANLISEYLDDQLTPELVARVEREILASDAMLAEVAAAHEILGLLRDPVTVEPRLRDRLYGLDPTGKTDVVRAIAGEVSARSKDETAPQWKPLTPRASSSTRTPLIVMGALAIGWLLVIVSDSALFGPRTKREAPVAKHAADDANDNPENRVMDKAGKLEGIVADVADGHQPEHAAAETDGSMNVKPQIAADGKQSPSVQIGKAAEVSKASSEPAPVVQPATGDVSAKPEMVAAVTDAVGANAGTTGKVTESTPPLPDSTDDDSEARGFGPKPEGKTGPYFLQGDSRSVLVFHNAQQRWFTLAQVPGGETLGPMADDINYGPVINLDWFGISSRFSLLIKNGSRGIAAQVIGPALIRLQDASTGGLDILSGRMKLSVDKSIGAVGDAGAEFWLGTGDHLVRLNFLSQDSRVAVEAVPIAAPAASASDTAKPADAATILPLNADLKISLTVLDGTVTLLSSNTEEPLMLVKGKRASWTVLERKEMSAVMVDNGLPLASTPAWLLGSEPEDTPETAKQKSRLLEALSKSGEPGDSVLSLLDDRNTEYGVFAVQVLSLSRDTDRLLSVLFEARDESIHRAAIDGLSEIAHSSMAGRQAIRKSLETRVSATEADATMELIAGLSEAQANDPVVAAELLAMLGSDRLATRTLAIYRMEQLTNDRKGFHPDAESTRRREAIRRWQRYVDQNSGRLLP